MTYVMLYEQILEDTLREYQRDYRKKLGRLYTPPIDCRLEDLTSYLRDAEMALRDANEIVVEPPSVNIREEIERVFEQRLNDYASMVSAIEDEESKKKQSADTANKQKIEDARKANNESINPLLDLHKELLTYKQTLEELLLRYNIREHDVAIQEGLDVEEMTALLKSSINTCKKLSLSKNGKSVSSKLVGMKDSKTEEIRKYGSIGLIVLIYVACPVLWILAALKLMTSSNKAAKEIDKLKIAYSAMYNYDFSVYIPEFHEEAVDVTNLEELDKAREQRLAELSSSDPNKELAKELEALAMNAEDLQQTLTNEQDKVIRELDEHKKEIQEIIEQYQKRLEEAKAASKEPASEMSTLPVLSHKYLLSRQDECIDIITEIGLENIVFHKGDPLMPNFIKLMLINIISSIRARQLEVLIYDPAGLGMEFANLITAGSESSQYLKVVTEDSRKLQEELRKYVQSNALKLKDKSIDEYNVEAEAIGKVALSYRLLVIMSGWEDILQDALFKQTLVDSTKLGLMCWLYGDGEGFGLPNAREYDKVQIKGSKVITVDPPMEFRVAEMFDKAVRESAVPTLFYESMFVPKVIPKEKWWTYNTIHGIELNPGFADGDPTKGFPLVFGDANVHAIMGGASGGGKSAMINQALCTLITKYSPRELELVMVDFKNVEFATYADTNSGLSRLPHAKVLAGTKDGEYAISIFQYLYDEMQRRTEFLTKHNEKKIEDYRVKNPDAPPIPRILVIIDEFQVMFTEVEQKAVDRITTLIQLLSKLARFCGCHLWFTSQSMKGTLSKDILDQFSLRMMLRASADASTDILGSPVAAKMPAKFGFVWTNDSAGEDPSKNVLWKVPFAKTDVINEIIANLNSMAAEQGLGKDRALFYDEKRLYHQEDLFKWYEDKGEFFKNPYTFILGERTAYSTNNAPVNFKMTKADGEHLICESAEMSDMLNLVMTFHDNLSKSDSNIVIMHSCDADCHTLLAMEELVQPDFEEYTKPFREDADFLELVETLIEGRKENGCDGKPPIYIFIVMADKLTFYKNDNFREGERFNSILKEAAALDIHLLLFVRQAEILPSQARNQFNHHIASKCSEKSAYAAVDDVKPSKLSRGDDDGYFAIYKYSDEMSKFKIYQHIFTRKLEARSVSF